MQQILQNKKLLIISALVMATILLIGIVMTVLALMASDTSETSQRSPQPNGNGQQLSTGQVTQLKGGVSSTRNLKGLTLRINQIETCNPSVVSAYVAVSSDAGVVNRGLSKDDVKVYLDGREVSNFDFNAVNNTQQPISNALVIDRSGSMIGAPIENARAAAKDYVSKLRQGDRVAVLQFDQSVQVLQGMTVDKQAAIRAIDSIQPGGDTAVYDALGRAIQEVPNCGRKAITLLSDGADRMSSTFTQQSVTDAINRANLPVFAVGIKGEGFNPAAVRAIAEATGGQYLEANTPTEISRLYGNIDGQLTGQFVANLKLNIPKDGKEHTLRIVSDVEGSETSSTRTFVY